ncbi:hypothetical protein LMG29542_06889 [Paraburkholderia humisilvae]|uniref:Uncharacterized protein n=1 Tax=Paraburkholderia humisilvae TaxID=627669 RepID=A0A6J5F145_9BURK|nr:hypothetical protein LMG29542_06889 [Paraburkholderia humisilvae]
MQALTLDLSEMRFTPVGPEKCPGFESQFIGEVVRQAGMPFTSSIFSRRKTGWVSVTTLQAGTRHFYKALTPNPLIIYLMSN